MNEKDTEKKQRVRCKVGPAIPSVAQRDYSALMKLLEKRIHLLF